MREFSNFPRDNGSHRSRCPPSHHEMALTPYYAQASARAPRPSPPSTHSPVSPGKVSPTTNRGARRHRWPQRHLPLATSCPLRAGGGGVPTRGRTIARLGRWHPPLLPQRRQSHCRARHPLPCQLRLLPPTLYQRWGGAPPRRQAVLWNAVNSVWHSPCLNAQDLLMQIHG